MKDRRGVLGFPMRLGIALLIIALFVPSLVTLVDHYNEESEVSEARSQAERVMTSAENVWYSGQGSSETLDVSVPSGYELRFGGSGADAWSYDILKGDDVKSKTYTESPSIMFIGDAVTLTGHCEISLVAAKDPEGRYGVEVRSA